MSKSKGRRLAEWLRNLDSNSRSGADGIGPGSITTAKLDDDAVTSAKIADSAVATAHLADTGVTFGKLHTALVVTESDGISSNDNDTTVATSAAIKDYVDAQVAGGLSNVVEDTTPQLGGNLDFNGNTATSFTSTGIDDNASSTAITIDSSQDVTFTSDAKFPDNGMAIFGAGSDLQIYHNGSHSFITDAGTGNLKIRGSNNINLESADGSQPYIIANGPTGWVKLHYAGSEKFITTSTGIDVTGDVNSDSVTTGTFTSTGIDDNASSTALTISSAGATTFSGDVILSEATPRLDLFDTDVTDSNFRVAMAGATTYVRSRGGTSAYGQLRFQRNNDGSTNLSVFGTTTGGDVIFYDDDGSTEGLRWDASTSRLGLSDGTPATMLQVGNSGTADSNAYITFGKRVASTETSLPFIGHDDYDGGGHNDLGLGAGSTNGTINFYTGNADDFTAANRRMSIESNGDVNIAGRLNVDTSGVGAGLSSLSITTNPFTIGDLTDFNLAFDSNEIQARNNGAANTLILNKHGGDVGIGIAPIYNLHIYESSSAGCWVMFSNSTTGSSSGNGALVGLDSAEEFNIRNYENTAIDFWTNNTQRMRISRDGKVGIGTGTSAPEKELQINLASTTTTTLGGKGGIELYAASSTVGNGGELTWMSGSGTTERWCAISGHITTNTADGSVGDLIIATKNATTGTTLTERLRVSSGGTITISNGSGSGSNGNLTLAGSSSGNEGGQINFNTVSSGTYSIDTHTDNMRFLNGTTAGDYLWYTNSNASIGMTLTGAGNLSVGSSATGGVTAYAINYADNDLLNVFGSLRSSGNTILTYGAKPSTTVNGGYVSAADNFSFSKAALEIGGGTLEFKKSASGTDTVGNALTMTNVFSINTAGDATFTGAVGAEGPDGGLVLRTWAGGSTYGMLGTANMGASEYALLTDGTNTFLAGGSGGSTYIRNGANDTSPQMIVKPSSIDFEGGIINQTGQINQVYSDTTGNSSTNAFTIDYNLSGNDTLSADRTKTGLFVDVDSSSTGGDTANEHRLYGIRSDVRATGDSDLMYGVYGYAESQHSSGTISQVAGVYGYGVADETSSGRTTNAYGLYGLGYGYGSGTGAAGSLYGCYARGHATAAQDKNTTAIYGGYFEVEIDDPGQAQTCTNAYGLRALMDDDSAGNVTGTGAYGLYVSFAGNWNFTNKYAIYTAGNHVSYFGGEVRAAGDVTAYYSDERLKIKKGKIENALEKVNSIETFYFTNNELAKSFGYTSDKLQVGVSAQSVEKVMPEVIKVAPFDADSQGNSVSGEDYKTVQYDKLVPLLIESIKELKAEIEELKKGR